MSVSASPGGCCALDRPAPPPRSSSFPVSPLARLPIACRSATLVRFLTNPHSASPIICIPSLSERLPVSTPIGCNRYQQDDRRLNRPGKSVLWCTAKSGLVPETAARPLFLSPHSVAHGYFQDAERSAATVMSSVHTSTRAKFGSHAELLRLSAIHGRSPVVQAAASAVQCIHRRRGQVFRLASASQAITPDSNGAGRATSA